jgi:hypothetical protein
LGLFNTTQDIIIGGQNDDVITNLSNNLNIYKNKCQFVEEKQNPLDLGQLQTIPPTLDFIQLTLSYKK